MNEEVIITCALTGAGDTVPAGPALGVQGVIDVLRATGRLGGPR